MPILVQAEASFHPASQPCTFLASLQSACAPSSLDDLQGLFHPKPSGTLGIFTTELSPGWKVADHYCYQFTIIVVTAKK